jgi:hypothetical protein
MEASAPGEPTGAWDSIHVFEAAERGRNAHYKLTSTVLLSLVTTSAAGARATLSGSMTRQIETDGPLADAAAHVGNIGRAVEDMESKMRNLLQEVRAPSAARRAPGSHAMQGVLWEDAGRRIRSPERGGPRAAAEATRAPEGAGRVHGQAMNGIEHVTSACPWHVPRPTPYSRSCASARGFACMVIWSTYERDRAWQDISGRNGHA